MRTFHVFFFFVYNKNTISIGGFYRRGNAKFYAMYD